jgi:hypothetical protein
MPKTTQTNIRTICNAQTYALMRDKGFTNKEIESIWKMPRQAVAAFQAWNTMSNRTWGKKREFPQVEIDPLTI